VSLVDAKGRSLVSGQPATCQKKISQECLKYINFRNRNGNGNYHGWHSGERKAACAVFCRSSR
jgi:hypothetical protein